MSGQGLHLILHREAANPFLFSIPNIGQLSFSFQWLGESRLLPPAAGALFASDSGSAVSTGSAP